jgi:hypothetical protein
MNKVVMVVRAGPDGNFVFTGARKGVYKLFARNKPTGAKGALAVTVNGVDPVTDVELVMRGPGKARIEGTVLEGPRPQAGITVLLTGPYRRRVIGSVTTDSRGKYAFPDLEKGSYRVIATKSASRTQGELTVTLNEGETKIVDVKLYR